jgi:hypothetical protein
MLTRQLHFLTPPRLQPLLPTASALSVPLRATQLNQGGVVAPSLPSGAALLAVYNKPAIRSGTIAGGVEATGEQAVADLIEHFHQITENLGGGKYRLDKTLGKTDPYQHISAIPRFLFSLANPFDAFSGEFQLPKDHLSKDGSDGLLTKAYKMIIALADLWDTKYPYFINGHQSKDPNVHIPKEFQYLFYEANLMAQCLSSIKPTKDGEYKIDQFHYGPLQLCFDALGIVNYQPRYPLIYKFKDPSFDTDDPHFKAFSAIAKQLQAVVNYDKDCPLYKGYKDDTDYQVIMYTEPECYEERVDSCYPKEKK